MRSRPTQIGCGAPTYRRPEPRSRSSRWRIRATRRRVRRARTIYRRPGSGRSSAAKLRVTNLDKVHVPGPTRREDPVTKRDLLRYAAQIAPTLLPYLAGRALNLHRFPNGAESNGFWHKALPQHAPEWLHAGTIRTPRRARPAHTWSSTSQPRSCGRRTSAALEWHPWTSRTEHSTCPAYALIDLDPGDRTTGTICCALARLHRTAFRAPRRDARPKVTGRRGIQIWVPIARRSGLRRDAGLGRAAVQDRRCGLPELVSWKWQKDDRAGLARLDYTQNAINKTLVAPYSPRPAAGAPVSAPIDWDELDDPALSTGRVHHGRHAAAASPTRRPVPRRLGSSSRAAAPGVVVRNGAEAARSATLRAASGSRSS